MRTGCLLLTFMVACARPAVEPREGEAPSTAPPTLSEPGAARGQAAEVTPEARQQIREYMWALSREVRALDEELEPGDTSDAGRYAIESQLERILEITAELQGDNRQFSHPVLSASLPRFREQVTAALGSVQGGEPSYINAGKVIGSCATCHDVRACPFDSYSRCIDESVPEAPR